MKLWECLHYGVIPFLHKNYDKDKIDEVVFGHGYVQGGGLNSARIASQQAGFPETIPAYVVIKACGSSLKAITNSVASIQTGQCEKVVVGGVESIERCEATARGTFQVSVNANGVHVDRLDSYPHFIIS